MKLPEQIYLKPLNLDSCLNLAVWDSKETEQCKSPYVSKEALLEWAEKAIEELDQYDRYESGLISGLNRLVEHLKSM